MAGHALIYARLSSGNDARFCREGRVQRGTLN